MLNPYRAVGFGKYSYILVGWEKGIFLFVMLQTSVLKEFKVKFAIWKNLKNKVLCEAK